MSVYEQIKADLGYLKLDAAAGAFATLAEQAKTEDWSHIEFLARLVAEYRPEVVVDAINTATAISYQDVYTSAIIAERDVEQTGEVVNAHW